MHWVVCPLDQLYELPADEQSCPNDEVHDESVPVTDGVKFGKTVIAFDAVEVQPFAPVTVTVYVPVDTGLMHCVVAPDDHE
jgi:hypothetical protein